MQRIGIFGGSFDPIHQGHLEIARCALQQLKLDQVLFVPAARSPFKHEKGHEASDEDRLAMTRLAVEDIPEFRVSAWELEQGGVSYTVDSLSHFRREYAGCEFFLLMGEDTYEGIERWKNHAEIRRMAHITIAPRVGISSPKGMARSDKFGDAPFYLKMPLCSTSSTQIKTDLSQTRTAGQAGLPEAVLQYIREHGLYQ